VGAVSSVMCVLVSREASTLQSSCTLLYMKVDGINLLHNVHNVAYFIFSNMFYSHQHRSVVLFSATVVIDDAKTCSFVSVFGYNRYQNRFVGSLVVHPL
jgi:hypothetical protein